MIEDRPTKLVLDEVMAPVDAMLAVTNAFPSVSLGLTP